LFENSYLNKHVDLGIDVPSNIDMLSANEKDLFNKNGNKSRKLEEAGVVWGFEYGEAMQEI
jgi:hypothetical protein